MPVLFVGVGLVAGFLAAVLLEDGWLEVTLGASWAGFSSDSAGSPRGFRSWRSDGRRWCGGRWWCLPRPQPESDRR